MQLLLITAFFLAMPWQAHAARGFGATYGAGAGDKVETTTLSTASTSRSWSEWIWVTGSGGLNFGGAFNALGGGMYMNNGSTVMQVAQTWTAGYVAGNFTHAGLNKWQHICATLDASSSSNLPVVYVNGTSVSVSNASGSPTGSPIGTAATAFVGGGGVVTWNGKLAEFAAWNGVILTSSQCKALSQGFSPLKIQPASLEVYLPLLGKTGEPNWGNNRTTQTVTGTASQPHPSVQGWPLMGGGQQ